MMGRIGVPNCFDPVRWGYFDLASLSNIHIHKYWTEDVSPFSNYVLQPIWDYLIRFVPLNITPNSITLAGTACLVLGFLNAFVNIPTFAETAHPFVYFASGITILLYLTFDNLDGRQARRTRTGYALYICLPALLAHIISSTPLGELLDHSCDSLCSSLVFLNLAMAFQLGESFHTVLMVIFGFWGFFGTTWEEYHTHCLYLGYINGASEGPCIVAGMMFATGIWGPQIWWACPSWTMMYEVRFFVLYGCMFVALLVSILLNCLAVMKTISNPAEREIEEDEIITRVVLSQRSHSKQEALSCLIPLATLSASLLLVFISGEEKSFNSMTNLLFGASFSFSFFTSGLILAHILDARYDRLYLSVGPLSMFLLCDLFFEVIPFNILTGIHMLILLSLLLHFAISVYMCIRQELLSSS